MAQQPEFDADIIQYGRPLEGNDLFINGDVIYLESSSTFGPRFVVGKAFCKTTVQIYYYSSQ